MRARASQLRQNRTVASMRAAASATSVGEARPSAQDSAQKARSPLASTWRARAELPSMPIDRSVLSRRVSPAPEASAEWPASSTSVHAAGSRP